MTRGTIKSLLFTLAALSIVNIAMMGQAQELTKIKRLIVARDGAAMNVKGDVVSRTIMLNDDTKVEAKKGMIGLRKDTLGFTDLIPGLPVEVETEHNGTDPVARSVRFKADDLKTRGRSRQVWAPTERSWRICRATRPK